MKDPRVYLAHMLKAIERIESYTRQGRPEFFNNPMAQDAVVRNLEILGEAARKVGEDFRAKHAEIPWRAMSGLRNVLIHDYDQVNVGRLWGVVEKDLPSVKKALLPLLPPLEQLERELTPPTSNPPPTPP